MAKPAASEIRGREVDRILQFHGGNGYSRAYETIAWAVVDGGRG